MTAVLFYVKNGISQAKGLSDELLARAVLGFPALLDFLDHLRWQRCRSKFRWQTTKGKGPAIAGP